jgi:hypothetical protein
VGQRDVAQPVAVEVTRVGDEDAALAAGGGRAPHRDARAHGERAEVGALRPHAAVDEVGRAAVRLADAVVEGRRDRELREAVGPHRERPDARDRAASLVAERRAAIDDAGLLRPVAEVRGEVGQRVAARGHPAQHVGRAGEDLGARGGAGRADRDVVAQRGVGQVVRHRQHRVEPAQSRERPAEELEVAAAVHDRALARDERREVERVQQRQARLPVEHRGRAVLRVGIGRVERRADDHVVEPVGVHVHAAGDRRPRRAELARARHEERAVLGAGRERREQVVAAQRREVGGSEQDVGPARRDAPAHGAVRRADEQVAEAVAVHVARGRDRRARVVARVAHEVEGAAGRDRVELELRQAAGRAVRGRAEDDVHVAGLVEHLRLRRGGQRRRARHELVEAIAIQVTHRHAAPQLAGDRRERSRARQRAEEAALAVHDQAPRAGHRLEELRALRRGRRCGQGGQPAEQAGDERGARAADQRKAFPVKGL